MEQIKGEKRQAVRRNAANKASTAIDIHNAVVDKVETVVETVEEVKDTVIEKEVETVNAVRRLIRSRNVQRVITSRAFKPSVGIMVVTGVATAAYFYGKRQGRKGVLRQVINEQLELTFDNPFNRPLTNDAHYEDAVDEAIANARPAPVVIDADKYERITETGEEFLTRHIPGTEIREVEPVRNNVFAREGVDNWNYAEEVANRTEREPYVIHKDEFYADEKDYTQTTLTYYTGDDILADEDEAPVYNPDRVIGSYRWGHGSGDPNTFHVRNDRLRTEYEIVKFEGHYAVEVRGMEPDAPTNQEIKHSRHHRFPNYPDAS